MTPAEQSHGKNLRFFVCLYSVSTYLLVKMGNGTCTIFVLYSTYSIKMFEDHFRYLYFLWLQIGIQKKPGENGKTSIWKRWIWGFNLSHCHRAQDSTYIYFVARFTPFSKVSQKSVKIVSSKRRLSTPDTPPEISPSHHLILQMYFVEETITKT